MVAIAQQMINVVEGSLDFFHMTEHFVLLFQLFLHTVFQVSIFQFLLLKAQVVFVLSALVDGHHGVLHRLFCFTVAVISLFVFSEQLLARGDDVHHLQLEVLFVQQQVLVLTVYVDELFAQSLDGGQRHGYIVDKGTAFS